MIVIFYLGRHTSYVAVVLACFDID